MGAWQIVSFRPNNREKERKKEEKGKNKIKGMNDVPLVCVKSGATTNSSCKVK